MASGAQLPRHGLRVHGDHAPLFQSTYTQSRADAARRAHRRRKSVDRSSTRAAEAVHHHEQTKAVRNGKNFLVLRPFALGPSPPPANQCGNTLEPGQKQLRESEPHKARDRRPTVRSPGTVVRLADARRAKAPSGSKPRWRSASTSPSSALRCWRSSSGSLPSRRATAISTGCRASFASASARSERLSGGEQRRRGCQGLRVAIRTDRGEVRSGSRRPTRTYSRSSARSASRRRRPRRPRSASVKGQGGSPS